MSNFYSGTFRVLMVFSFLQFSSAEECLPSEYKCQNGRCISLSQVCNGQNDCEGGDDEDAKCEALLFYTKWNEVKGFFLKSRATFSFENELVNGGGISQTNDHLFWIMGGYEKESLIRSNKNGTDLRVWVDVGVGQLSDVEVDYVTGNIYFTDSMAEHIGVCNEMGDICTVLHRGNFTYLMSLALYPKKGLMYWTDCDRDNRYNAKIETSAMDGSNRKPLITEGVWWPNGLAIDISQDRLYWIDKKTEKMETVQLDGSDRRVVLEKSIKNAFSLAVFEDTLYWSDVGKKEIKMCNKVSCENPSSFIKDDVSMIYTIPAWSHRLKIRVKRLLCFLTANNSYACGCPENSVLEDDKHTCREIFKPLRFAAGGGNKLSVVSAKFLGRKNETREDLPSIHEIGCMTYDSLTSSLIISNPVNQRLYRYNLSSTQFTPLLYLKGGKIISMSFDSFGNNLYFCTEGKNTVNVLSLHTKHQITIYRTAEGVVPTSLVTIPEHGIFFLAVKTNGTGSLMRVTLDGKNISTCVSDIGYQKEISLTYSKKTQKVFWTSYGTKSIRYPREIKSININCSNEEVLKHNSRSSSSISITSDDGLIIWLDQSSNVYFYAEDQEVFPFARTFKLRGDEKLRIVVSINEITSNNLHPCQNLNGGCSHVCLVTSNDQESLCRCPSEKHLRSDNKTCEDRIDTS